MANFGFADLRVVRPYDVAFREAVSAVGGAGVLSQAKVFDTVAEAVADCSLVVGTTAGTRRVPHVAIDRIEPVATLVKAHSGRTAILFGSEKFGLSNEDMSFCHVLARIPTMPGTPSMNLGQAVAICVYELIRESGELTGRSAAARRSRYQSIEGAEAEQLTGMLLEVLRMSGYTNRITAVSTDQKIRRWIRRLRIGRGDAPLLLGVLRQILWKLGKE